MPAPITVAGRCTRCLSYVDSTAGCTRCWMRGMSDASESVLSESYDSTDGHIPNLITAHIPDEMYPAFKRSMRTAEPE